MTPPLKPKVETHRIEDLLEEPAAPPTDLDAKLDAKTILEAVDTTTRRAMVLTIFGGYELDKAAETMGVSRRTVANLLAFGKVELQRLFPGMFPFSCTREGVPGPSIYRGTR